MDPEYGLSRSSINMRLEPKPGSSVVHYLRPQERVVILGESDDMLEVESTRWRPPVRGFAPRSAIVRPQSKPEVFPRIELGIGMDIPAVPRSLPLTSFLNWLGTSEESPWLPSGLTEAIRLGRLPSVGKQIRESIEKNRAAWDAWVAAVNAEERLDSCTLDEWVVLRQGGRDMWSIRAERLFSDASAHGATLGWVVPDDVVRWTGRVRENAREPKYKLWYEIELTKADKFLTGWYKASLLDEYFAPTPLTDLLVPENRLRAFDLSQPLLRLPADPEIADSRKAGRAAAQYIDIRRAGAGGLLHHNLCGEFCAAALGASDVISMLQTWLAAYPRARNILSKDQGTSIPDLQSMLDVLGLKHEFFRTVSGISPVTPTYVRRKLDAGFMAIVGTGVTRFGAIKARSGIRHWVIVEDIVPVGSSGWLRVFNPFSNREEVYRFEEVYDLPARDSIGLWVEPRRVAGVEGVATVAAMKPEVLAPSLEPALTA